MTESALFIVLAYLLGAFPSAYLLGRRLKSLDVTEVGSRNVGALNAYRQVGKAAGLTVLMIDAGKGALVVFLGQILGVSDTVLYASAIGVTVGHNFSPVLRFRGGKGAATVFGISAVMLWHVTAISAATGAVMFGLTRRVVVSLGGAFILLNLLTVGTLQPTGQIALCLALSLIVAGTHFGRQRPDIMLALRNREWRRLMSIE